MKFNKFKTLIVFFSVFFVLSATGKNEKEQIFQTKTELFKAIRETGHRQLMKVHFTKPSLINRNNTSFVTISEDGYLKDRSVSPYDNRDGSSDNRIERVPELDFLEKGNKNRVFVYSVNDALLCFQYKVESLRINNLRQTKFKECYVFYLSVNEVVKEIVTKKQESFGHKHYHNDDYGGELE